MHKLWGNSQRFPQPSLLLGNISSNRRIGCVGREGGRELERTPVIADARRREAGESSLPSRGRVRRCVGPGRVAGWDGWRGRVGLGWKGQERALPSRVWSRGCWFVVLRVCLLPPLLTSLPVFLGSTLSHLPDLPNHNLTVLLRLRRIPKEPRAHADIRSFPSKQQRILFLPIAARRYLSFGETPLFSSHTSAVIHTGATLCVIDLE